MNRGSLTPTTLVRKPLQFALRSVETVQSGSALGDAVRSSRDAILSYHAVGERSDAGYFGNISTERFRESIEYLVANADIVPLSAIPKEGSGRRVAVTFDDGLKSVYTDALPILREYDVPATVFLNPAFLDDRNRELAVARHGIDDTGPIMLGDEAVAELVEDPLITVGNHTLTHRDLSAVDDTETLRTEIIESKHRLEDRYGISVEQFSYPHGAFSERSRRLVEATHEISVTAASFLVDEGVRHQLPRLSGHKSPRAFRWGLTSAGDRLNRVRYHISNRRRTDV